MKQLRKVWGLTALTAIIALFFAGLDHRVVSANNTPQTLPFTQDWSNIGLITVNDNWSAVPGIEGFLGQDITTATGVDPRTLLTTSTVANDLDVIANQTNPDTLATGGVAEFEITNPTIALNGSGTADAPHIIINLNTTGQNNIRVAYNLRDLDASADNAIQPVALQYRIGNTGNFINVAGGFVADATTGPSQATLVTPVAATLPAAANNQPVVQVRIITSNAVGNDEWVGIDDINITTVSTPAGASAVLDYNGDGRTDYVVVRNTGGGSGGAVTWFINFAGSLSTAGARWGISTDFFLDGDFDGDGRSDITVFRPSSTPSQSNFFILQSATNTARIENFGLNGDDPTVVEDYDGDGKTDVAVYREGLTPDSQSTWFYRGSLNNPSGNITYAPWGKSGDFPVPGDFDGDGRADLVVQRSSGGGQGQFWMLQTTAGFSSIIFGNPTDQILPGDYDGDGKTDLAVARGSGGNLNWWYRRSIDAAIVGPIAFGLSATDFPTQGDYDGDGRTDIAVWRPNADATQTYFWIRNSSTAAVQTAEWGQQGDYPVANYNSH
jgi:hypothetical protein